MTAGLKIKTLFMINITDNITVPIEMPSFYCCNCSPVLSHKYLLLLFPNRNIIPSFAWINVARIAIVIDLNNNKNKKASHFVRPFYFQVNSVEPV